MRLEDKIKESMLDYLKDRGVDAVKVVRWEEETENDGYCETCWYEYDVVIITYENADGVEIAYTVRDSFADFISQLTA